MKITADLMHFKELNNLLRESKDTEVTIDNCIGQRYIASASKGKNIVINGTPGNALGCYLDGSTINVYGNTQEATGDTMNEGAIYVHGMCGDATGYGMRGGKIIIHGNSGYRTGIHMKSYQDRIPVIVIGGSAGSFLGEYQAGGIIIVLGMNTNSDAIVGNFCGTGMHGGMIFLRCEENELPINLPKQVKARKATEKDFAKLSTQLDDYCEAFGEDKKEILNHNFMVIVPDHEHQSKQIYTYS